MKHLHLLISFAFLATASSYSTAQEFRGGEIKAARAEFASTRFLLTIDLYFKDNSGISGYEQIAISYGDASIDTIVLSEIIPLGNDIKLYRYHAEHIYAAHSSYQVTVLQPFYLEDIENLSSPTNFFLQTTLRSNSFFWMNIHYPEFENFQTDYTIEDGIFRHQLIASDPEDPIDFQYENFFVNELPMYSLPAATNAITLDTASGEFIWDKPLAAGKYFLAFAVNELGGIGRKKERFMIVEIKESDLATSTETTNSETLISLSPNPTSDQFQLQLGGFHAPVQVRIFDALGRMIYERQAAASQLETLRIAVNDWPQGIYQVQIQSEGKMLTRQIVVQR